MVTGEIHGDGLLVEGPPGLALLPRCGTTLSDHEVGPGLRNVTDPSVFVRMPVIGGDRRRSVSPASRCCDDYALDVGLEHRGGRLPDASTRSCAPPDGETLVVAEALREAVVGDAGFSNGSAVIRWSTSTGRPSTWSVGPRPHYVITGDYVTTGDGSGLVHIAPAFGADDLDVARGYGLPVVNPVHADGTFDPAGAIGRRDVLQDADPVLVDDLRSRRLLFAKLDFEHNYPHCWRCHTPAVYAQPSWFIGRQLSGPAAGRGTKQPIGTRRRSSGAATGTG